MEGFSMNLLRRIFRLDLRALAAYRILLAAAVVCYLLRLVNEYGWSLMIAFGLATSMLMMFGLRTRLLVASTWLATTGAIANAGLLLAIEPRVIMALLFLSLFLPLGARYSLDSSMDLEPQKSNIFFSAASTVFVVQIASIFSVDLIRLWPTNGQPAMTVIGTVSPIVLLSGLIAVTPKIAMDALSQWAWSIHKGGLRIYFDRDCGFCRKICLIFRTFFLLGDTPVTPAQEDAEAYANMQKFNTWVVYDYDDQIYIRWHAVLLLMRRSLLFRPLGLLLTAAGMGQWADRLYGAIASSRRWWSQATAILLPYRHISAESGTPANVLIGIWVGAMLLFNFWSPFRLLLLESAGAHVVMSGFALNQNWLIPLATSPHY